MPRHVVALVVGLAFIGAPSTSVPLSAQTTRTLGIGAVVAVLVLWALISATGLVSPNKLPAPWQVAKAFGYLAWDGENGRSLLLTATMWSVGRVLAAGALVVAIGIPIGVFMGASPKVNAALSPLGVVREPLPYPAGFVAGRAFLAYRRRGGSRSSPLPDFYIGAHAAVAGYRLLTRDARRYRAYFSRLDLIAPD